MRTRLTLRPHQRGAKQLLAQYGSRLLCVRYRYDEKTKKRLKTVELIIEESDWTAPPVPRPAESRVHVRVAVTELDLRRRIKRSGGIWHPERIAWELRYDQVVALALVDRIVEEDGSIYG